MSIVSKAKSGRVNKSPFELSFAELSLHWANSAQNTLDSSAYIIVPLRTLTVVFETPSSVPEFGVPELSPQRQAEVNELLNYGEKKRLTLDRWAPEKRRQALEQQRFERSQEGAIERIIALELEGFSGAEWPGSERDIAVRNRIGRITRGGSRLLRASLIDHLRDYQVQYNHHAKSQVSLPAVL